MRTVWSGCASAAAPGDAANGTAKTRSASAWQGHRHIRTRWRCREGSAGGSVAGRTMTRGPFCLDEPYQVTDELGHGGSARLLQHARAIGLDRSLTRSRIVRNPLVEHFGHVNRFGRFDVEPRRRKTPLRCASHRSQIVKYE